MKNYSGFTLIELVLVIVILGILSVVALPKFVDLSKEARIAVLDAAQGSAKSAMHIVYSRSVIEGEEKIGPLSLLPGGGLSTTASVNIEGLEIRTHYGYPQDNAIAYVAGLSDEFRRITAGQTKSVVIYKSNFNCKFRYDEATPTQAARVYRIEPEDTSGC